jgi:hypothetical protein
MSTIHFDKDEYKAGETATITYVDALPNTLAAVRRGGLIIHRKVLVSGGSGSFEYSIPSTLGTYEAVLIHLGRVRALDTMKVVSGAAPPPVNGETRELDLGDYEVTWTLSGQDTLKAEIKVTDTGVTCLSVTGGGCNRTTPPGVTISAFTVTGHLKSAVAPPTKGYLSVDTSPTGATVTVNGVSCGTTPVTACELSTGSKTVTIAKSGYNTVTRSVTISAGQTSNLGTITLTPTGAPPVASFDDWVAKKGGKDAITGGDTGADVNKATDYYLGLG